MKRYRMVCRLHIGHVLLQTAVWTVVSVFTLGLALPFFAYYFVRLMINHTELEEITEVATARAISDRAAP